MEDRRYAFRVLVGRPEGKSILDRPRHRGRIVSKWIFKKWDGEMSNGLSWLRIGTGGGLLGMWTGLSWLRIGTGGGLLGMWTGSVWFLVGIGGGLL